MIHIKISIHHIKLVKIPILTPTSELHTTPKTIESKNFTTRLLKHSRLVYGENLTSGNRIANLKITSPFSRGGHNDL